MADITLSYKGSTIAEINASGTKTMNTAGKYCEDDITLVYVKPPQGPQFTLTVEVATGSAVSATDGTTTLTGTSVNDECVLTLPNAGTWAVSATLGGYTTGAYVEIITDYDVELSYINPDPVLDNNTWEMISQVSQAQQGPNVWSVGDTKGILLSGTCGILSLNTTLYCYILGFDHNSTLEGTGIQFGTWKTAASNGTDACLVDSNYSGNKSDGTKTFNMNHWGSSSSPYNTNNGGWKGCDARYDILGSTDTAPSGYGSTPQSNRVGYDASSTTATSPVANTLMSCLSSSLRSVMKPITKYTNNIGKTLNVSGITVTASIDYLPLLAEYEVWGERSNADQYEQTKQAQYAYYAAGNSKYKYKHDDLSTAAHWWGRSPYYSNNTHFCITSSAGAKNTSYSRRSIGMAPCFMV